MKRIFILVLFVIACQISFGQVYQLMPQYGYQALRMSFDSTLQIPTVCGVPTLKSVYNTKRGAIAFDSCNNRFYTYNPKTTTWSYLGSGGGGSTDTTSLSNRINQKVDSIKRRSDSVFYYKNGTSYFAYKDSVGGGTSTGINGLSGTTEIGLGGSLSDAITYIESSTGNESIAWGGQSPFYEYLISSQNISLLGFPATADTGTYKPLVIDPITHHISNLEYYPTSSANGFVPYTGATQDVDLGTNKISAHSVYITGTNGNGHLHLKHQSSDATATGQSTSLYADNNGDIKWKNDGNYYTTLKTSGNTADRVYTYPNATTTLIGASDTATMLSPYLKKSDTSSLSSRINLKVNISDTATMLANYQLKTPSVAYLSSDFNTTNTTATNTNLTIPVEANTAYRIMISGTASKATSSTGMKISIGAPTGTTIKALAALGANAISTTTNSFITSVNSLGSTFATGVGVEVPFRVEGILVTSSTAGSITLQGATVTSNTATIYANTLMTITKAYAQ